jgi:hypothetical protein
MKKILIILLMMLFAFLIFPRKIGELTEVLKPDNISVFQEDLFVAEGSTFYIYSIENLHLKKKFGRKGEGPGEILSVPNFPTRVHGFPDYVLVEGLNKIVFFSRKGEFIKEIRKPTGTTQMLPLGNHYVAKRIIPSEDNRTIMSAIYLYDSEMKLIKSLYNQRFVQQGSPPNLKLDMVSDFINFRICDGKLFIEESSKGFFIEVFDENGNKLYEIRKNPEPVLVTASHRDQLIADLKEDPWVKPQIKALGGWEQVKKIIKFEFREHFPAIQNLDISDHKLLVQTFREKQGKEEYIIMDLSGKIEKTVYIPCKVKVSLMPQIMGVKLYAIHNQKLFYIKENEVDETWELHAENIFRE